jgi:hypothetical protein
MYLKYKVKFTSNQNEVYNYLNDAEFAIDGWESISEDEYFRAHDTLISHLQLCGFPTECVDDYSNADYILDRWMLEPSRRLCFTSLKHCFETLKAAIDCQIALNSPFVINIITNEFAIIILPQKEIIVYMRNNSASAKKTISLYNLL